MYVQSIFLHTHMAEVVEILPMYDKTYLFNIDSIMGADELATQGAAASSTMTLTYG